MTIPRADRLARADKRRRFLLQAAAYALLALLGLSQTGCVSKPPSQPNTVQEFLKQPRPQ